MDDTAKTLTNPSAQLRENLSTYFNEDELLVLCHDLTVDCENFPDEGKARLVIDLIGYMARNGRLPELVTTCRQLRPHVDWDDILAAARQNPNRFIGRPAYSLPPALHPRQWRWPVWIGIAIGIVAMLGLAGWMVSRNGAQQAETAAQPTRTPVPTATLSPTETAVATLPPGVLGIPRGETAVLIDGVCDETGEYSDAFADTYPDWDAKGRVFFKHDGEYLYACVNAPVGTDEQRFFSLDFAPENGNGFIEFTAHPVSGQVSTTAAISGWLVRSTINEDHESAEFRVPLDAINNNPCLTVFRLTIFHFWVTGSGEDYNWPNGRKAGYRQPAIWRRGILQQCPAA